MNPTPGSSVLQDGCGVDLENTGLNSTCVCLQFQVEGAVGANDGRKKRVQAVEFLSVSCFSSGPTASTHISSGNLLSSFSKHFPHQKTCCKFSRDRRTSAGVIKTDRKRHHKGCCLKAVQHNANKTALAAKLLFLTTLHSLRIVQAFVMGYCFQPNT